MSELGALHPATGRCACGQLTYACAIESEVALCACDLCQRSSGSGFQAWVNADRARLSVSGQTASWASTTHAVRHFCATCGSPLFLFEADEPAVVEICAGSIDAPDGIKSSRHAFTQKRPAWTADKSVQ